MKTIPLWQGSFCPCSEHCASGLARHAVLQHPLAQANPMRQYTASDCTWSLQGFTEPLKLQVEGIITERDYLRKVAVTGKSSKQMACSALMTSTSQIVTLTPEDTVAKVRAALQLYAAVMPQQANCVGCRRPVHLPMKILQQQAQGLYAACNMHVDAKLSRRSARTAEQDRWTCLCCLRGLG
jgi:hypothetical protein